MEGELVVVTGAAGGMGLTTVDRLVRDGFQVAAIDINEKGLADLDRKYGDRVKSYQCDQTTESDVRNVIGKILTDIGPIDALVNMTGWVGKTKFIEEDSAYWRKVMAVNLESAFYVTQPVLAHMIERKKGKIVYIASDAGRVGTSGEAVYSAAKAGIMAFAKSLARENARYNINVNVISPGVTQTPLLESDWKLDPDNTQRMMRIIPFRRPAKPEEQASVVSFFCSPDSSYITGQILSVSGGLTMV